MPSPALSLPAFRTLYRVARAPLYQKIEPNGSDSLPVLETWAMVNVVASRPARALKYWLTGPEASGSKTARRSRINDHEVDAMLHQVGVHPVEFVLSGRSRCM